MSQRCCEDIVIDVRKPRGVAARGASWRYSALLLVVALECAAQSRYDVVEKSVEHLSADLGAGRVSSETLTRAYLSRIERIDRNGLNLRAVLAVNPQALEQARALDRERRAGHVRGRLHGVPILLKDNIESIDPMPTTAGSLALTNNQAARDAPIVARLRAAGAVILGKTNLSEWANFRSEHSVSGWSDVGGLTKNPYVLDRNACGSSSGSAVAVAASLAAAAIGTETDGSITCPAAVNGIVGLKPTLGILSGAGIVPIAHSQDTAGPMTRTVADAALLMRALTRDDPSGAPTFNEGAWRGKRIGVLRFAPGVAAEVNPVYEQALSLLRDAGATLVETQLPAEDQLAAAEMTVLLSEFKSDINAYLADAPSAVATRSLEALIAFNRASQSELRLFGQELFIRAQATAGANGETYREALATSKRLAGPEGLQKVLEKDRLDALVSPTTGAAWRIDLVRGDHFAGSATTYPAVSGYPHLSLPMGYAHELPVGLSIIGPAGSDKLLLELAYAFEQKARARRPPKYLPSIDADLERSTQ